MITKTITIEISISRADDLDWLAAEWGKSISEVVAICIKDQADRVEDGADYAYAEDAD